ncbi:MAG: hypothetical protein NC037_05505 [Bacteroides sp.]|nr:hypothetical protein [Bacillota bacterium]MCM1455961.1 hypothetical protein [Bacteroides sp.]
MYGIYGDIIVAAERALECFEETEELLEYPEVQADKAYYLSVLSKYNGLKVLKDNLTALKAALDDEKATLALLADASSDKERDAVYAELTALKRSASELSASLSDALGCRHAEERAYLRMRFKEVSSKFGTELFALIKADMSSRGVKILSENAVSSKDGYVQEISCIFEGVDVIARLSPLSGAHKVYIAKAQSEEICFAVTPSAKAEAVSENDLKIDVFHSSGAGGQNVNKVETAVRVTHIPTGLSVVCQDERSQLKNKRRALETIEKRLNEMNEQAEKSRIEADVRAQFAHKNTPLSFDSARRTLTDTRLKAFSQIPFPLTNEQFTSYLNGLMAL